MADGESYGPEHDLITWINAELRKAKSDVQEWRKKAKESYDFFSSDQWTEDEKSDMTEKGKIPIVFNRIARTINAVSGLEVQNRQEVRYIPRELGDAGVNEVLTSAAKWVRDNCDAEDEESEAFQDTLICGMGWTETWMDYESDRDGLVRIDRTDPLDMLWDSQSKKRNIDDAKWVARFKKIPKAEFQELWPDATFMQPAVDLESDTDQPHDADDAKFYRENNPQKFSDKTVTVVQFQWWEKETYHMVQQSDGKIIELDAKRWKKLKDVIEGMGLKHVKRTRKVYKQAFVNGNQVLEEGDGPCKDNFSLRCVTGLRNRNDNTWFGIVELMKDPQRWANKWLSQIMYIISVNAKGGLLAEKEAFDNIRKAEDDWAKPDAITWLKPGGLQKIQEKGQAEYPEGLDRLLQYALQSINDVPGVNLELLGLADRQQAGYLEAQRKQAGITILAVFFDALRRYRKEQGRVLAYFIKEYISDGRLIRVLGNNGMEQYIPLVRDPETSVYDVVVDDAPTSPDMKEKVFAILTQLMPNLQAAGIPIPPDFLDYTPLPESMTKKWKEYIEQIKAQGPPPDPRVEAEKAKLQLDQQRFQFETQSKQQAAELDAQLEMEKVRNKAMLDAEALRAEIELKRQRDAAELQMQRERMMGELTIKSEVEKIRAKKEPARANA